MAKIEYEDKVALIVNPDIPDINKVTNNDMNEIKQVVNENDDKFLTNGLNVSNEVDEDYRVNVLHSKNLVENILETQTKNGVTFTKNNNGSITLSGTATTNFTMLINTINLKAGKTYTISGGSSISANVRLDMRTSLDGSLYENNWYLPNTATKTISSDITLFFSLRIASGTNTSGITIYPMINEGSTALPYEPYITPSIYVDNEEIYSEKVKTGRTNIKGIPVNYYKYNNVVCISIDGALTSDMAGYTQYSVQLPTYLAPPIDLHSFTIDVEGKIVMVTMTSGGYLQLYEVNATGLATGKQVRTFLNYITTD